MDEVDAVQSALEPLWPVFDEAMDVTGDFSAMTEGQRAVAFAWVLSGLVDNGGWPSWVESAGHWTAEARAALVFLGAVEYLPLLDEVLRLYPSAAADDPDVRLSASEQWTAEEATRAESLGESFYRLSEAGDLVVHHAARYVAAHPDEFAAGGA